MLGRSANGIFWMSRYLERAENVARLLDVGFRMALTRGNVSQEEEWHSVLTTIGQDAGFRARYDDYAGPQVFNYILRDKDNPLSVLRMIENARTNARSVRTSITREVWETTNEAWMVLRDMLARPVRERGLREALTAVRRQTMLVRGAMQGTMLRNEVFNFSRIGKFIERADNTARILDVKYYVLLPSVAWVGSSLDNVQWEAVLRSVAGDRAYRWLNAGALDPRGIAEFLILDQRFPRSLVFSYEKLNSNLRWLAREYGCETAVHQLVGEARNRLQETTINAIIDQGLHEFITGFIARNIHIATAIARDYRFVE
ncbi:MAG: alpha-E domain-containing protein [Novosphingobium sp.]